MGHNEMLTRMYPLCKISRTGLLVFHAEIIKFTRINKITKVFRINENLFSAFTEFIRGKFYEFLRQRVLYVKYV